MQLKDNKGKETYFLAMRTVFTTAQPIETCYDLKGSVAGRVTAEKGTSAPHVHPLAPCAFSHPGADRKPGAPMKDLDFDRVVELHPTLHTRLLATLERDAKFLAAQGVMDYSLLLGITHQQPTARNVQLGDGGWPAASVLSGREVYYLGVIDYLVKFSTLKLLESTFKSFKYARVSTTTTLYIYTVPSLTVAARDQRPAARRVLRAIHCLYAEYIQGPLVCTHLYIVVHTV